MKSLLFSPGDSESKLAKGLAAGADVLLIDLEDSVALDNKAAARAQTAAFVRATRGQSSRSKLYVRINPLDTPFWSDDLAAVVQAGPDGILLPKPQDGADVRALDSELDVLEGENGPTRIIALTSEVPLAVLRMESFIGSSPRLVGLTWGAEDLSAELGAQTNRGEDGRVTSPYRMARDLTLLTACAAGVVPIDTVYPNFRDMDGFRRECEEAVRDGFAAKMAIHPDQVAVINEIFTPSAEAVRHAREIVAAFAEAGDAGVVAIDGEMYDRPHLLRAQRVLSSAG